MKKTIIACWVLMGILPIAAQVIAINHRRDAVQNGPEKLIAIESPVPFVPDPEKAAISRIEKIVGHGDSLFILDPRQSRIFVLGPDAEFRYAFGRPGQGPGDLENPVDMFISGKGLVYVLGSFTKRIEVLSLKGEFVRRIELGVPRDVPYSVPERILVGRDGKIYIAYSLSAHLVDRYHEDGKFEKTLLLRKDPVRVPGENIGNSSQILFSPGETFLLHFDRFRGVFTRISPEGVGKTEFGSENELHKERVSKYLAAIDKSKPAAPNTSVMISELWSDCCLDDRGRICVYSLLRKKPDPRELYVFSAEGKLLGREVLPTFNDQMIMSLSFIKGRFLFVTSEEKIFTARIISE
ncbi:MAG: 6-bladed beta-propeller [Candidatus Aminicenantales bacterium]